VNTQRLLLAALVLVPATLPAVDLDSAFGTGGRVVLDDGVSRGVNDAILTHDGKIVVVGQSPGGGSPNRTTMDPTRDVIVARFNTNGTLDTTFDGDGLVTLDFGGNTDDRGYDIAEQADGKLVVAGSAQNAGLDVDAAVARLNPNGSLDTSFHGTGILVLPQTGTQIAYAVAIQGDGKLLLGGYSSPNPPQYSPRAFAVVRLLADGTPDVTYGVGGTGVVTTPTQSSVSDTLFDVALQADGKLVGVGDRFNGAAIYGQAAAVRLDATGMFDSTFGANGLSIIDHDPAYYQEQSRRIVVLPNQSLLLAGTNVPLSGDKPLEGAVLRLGATGLPDTTFGTNGWARGVNGTYSDIVNAVALEASGNILVAGSTARDVSDAVEDLAVSRLTANGALDPSFGTQGHFVVDFSASGTTYSSRANAVLLQADGRAVVVGVRGTLSTTGAIDPPTQRLALARLCTPTLQFTAATTSVSESATVVNLTVHRSCGAPVSVKYATTAGTASAGSDFTAVSDTLTWTASDPDDKTIAIQLPGDTADEPDEQFTVALTDASGGTLASPNTATVTIMDNDDAAPLSNGGGGPVIGGTGNLGGSGGGGALDYAFLLGLLAICSLSLSANALSARQPE